MNLKSLLLREKELIDRVISLVAISLSVFSMFFTIHTYQSQFERDMRPFVGISAMQEKSPVAPDTNDAGGVHFELTIKNFGKLPAAVSVHESWAIVKAGTSTPVQQGTQDVAPFTSFPGLEIQRSVNFDGVLAQYVRDPRYEAVIDYEIRYTNAAISGTWTTKFGARYNPVSGLRTTRSEAN